MNTISEVCAIQIILVDAESISFVDCHSIKCHGRVCHLSIRIRCSVKCKVAEGDVVMCGKVCEKQNLSVLETEEVFEVRTSTRNQNCNISMKISQSSVGNLTRKKNFEFEINYSFSFVHCVKPPPTIL